LAEWSVAGQTTGEQMINLVARNDVAGTGPASPLHPNWPVAAPLAARTDEKDAEYAIIPSRMIGA